MNLDQPLSDAELDELEAFLNSDQLPEARMDLSMLDGFLSALAIGPNTLMPSDWLPVVWGETDEEPARFADDAQAGRVIGLVMRLYNDRIHDLAEGTDQFDPLLYLHDRDGVETPILEAWCTGFMTAVELDHEAWRPLMTGDDNGPGAFLTPMILFGVDDPEVEAERARQLGREREFADMLGTCVLGVRDFWLPYRKAERAPWRREGVKVGRNDPCPCGSGRKYKQCCGKEPTRH